MTNTTELKTTIRVLKQARDYVSKGWTKHVFFERVDGQACYCALGALRRATGGGVTATSATLGSTKFQRAADALEAALRRKAKKGWVWIPDWNDSPRRTQKQVVDAFDLAIERAEKELAKIS